MLLYSIIEGFDVDGQFVATRTSVCPLVTSDSLPDEISKMSISYPIAFSGDDEAGAFRFDDDYVICYSLDSVRFASTKQIAYA